MCCPEFFHKHYKSDIFIITEKPQRNTEDTKLDVDGASLCVLCVSWCFLCENYVALELF